MTATELHDNARGSFNDLSTASAGDRRAPLAWFALLVVLVAFGLICRPQLSIPLNRDEGEFAYGGQLLRTGGLPYVDLYAMKLPGMYLALAAIQALGGEAVETLHAGAAIVNAATACILFLIVRRMLGPGEAVAAAVAFLLWVLNPRAEPFAIQAEVFVIFFATLGWWLLLLALEHSARFAITAALVLMSGLAFGLGTLMKQHGLILMLGAGAYAVWWLWLGEGRRDASHPWWTLRWALLGTVWIVAAALPWVTAAGTYAYLGQFDKFWFWTVTTSQLYGNAQTLEQGLSNLTGESQKQFIGAPCLWCSAGIGATAIAWSASVRRHAALIAFLAVFSVLAMAPKLLFRNHYFLLAGPAAAVLVACGLRGLGERLSALVSRPAWQGWISAAIGAVLLGWTAFQDAHMYYTYPPALLSRTLYGFGMLTETVEIAEFLRAHTDAEDRIAVMGSEPQIFYLSGRRSASPHIYTYPLMEPNDFAIGLQKEMISDLQRTRPKYFVWVNSPYSWLMQQGSDQEIIRWFDKYRKSQLEEVVVYVLVDPYQVERREANDPAPRGLHWMAVYQRKAL